MKKTAIFILIFVITVFCFIPSFALEDESGSEEEDTYTEVTAQEETTGSRSVEITAPCVTVKPPQPETTAEILTPRLIVDGYGVTGEVRQGNTVTLKITVKNLSGAYAAKNMLLTFDGGEDIICTAPSPQYVEKIDKNSSYIWKLPVKISESSEGGNITATVSWVFEQGQGESYEGSGKITIYVPALEETTTENSVTDPQTPRLMITGVEKSCEYLSYESECIVTIMIKNTSSTKDVENLKLTFLDEKDEIQPTGTGTQFVQSIKKQGTYEWKLPLRATNNAAAGEHKVTVQMEYDDSAKNSFTASDTVRLQVRQSTSLSYSGAQLPVKVTQGESISMSVNLMNTGKGTVYNCIVSYEIENIESGGETLVGEIKAGETKTGSASLRVDSDFIGQAKGKVHISFEDEYGEKFEEWCDVSTLVQEKIAYEEIESTEEEGQQKNSLWWLFIIIGVICGGGIAAAVIISIINAKQRKIDEETL